MDPTDWRSLGHRYYPLGLAMRREFGCNIRKISVDAGFSCPNIDGTVGRGGCIFCNTHDFSPSRRLPAGLSIHRQIDEGVRQRSKRCSGEEKYIAYFQPSTNTYAAPAKLEKLYRQALDHPAIVGLAIGTRPDALPDEVLDLLTSLSRSHFVQLEIGLQSIHRKSLDFLRRGHDYPAFLDAFLRVRERRLRLGVHLILGIPGESREDVLATAAEMTRLKPESVKLHHLYVVRDTPLADLWNSGSLPLPTLDEYAGTVVDFLEHLSPEIVVERISGEASDDYLIAPDWTSRKQAARNVAKNAVDREFRRRNSFQGDRS